MITRPLLAAAGLGLVLMTAGCNNRQNVELDELRADNTRMAQELDALYKENALLKVQRDRAREELVLQQAQTKGLEEQLRASLASGALNIEGVEVTGEGLSIADDFAFPKGSATLNSDGQRAISQVARLLNSSDYAGTKVFVTGHTDNTPVSRAATKKAFGDNWGLSAMRAAAVVRALQKAKVPASRLIGTFRGEYSPRADNTSKDGKAKNRRVNIQVSL